MADLTCASAGTLASEDAPGWLVGADDIRGEGGHRLRQPSPSRCKSVSSSIKRK